MPPERKRLEFLKTAFEETGQMNHEEIMRKLNAKFQYDFEESKRTIYRDLEKLVGEIFIKEALNDEEQTLAADEVSRGKSKIWLLNRLADKSIPGYPIVKQLAGELCISKRANRIVSIQTDLAPKKGCYQLVFSLGGRILSLNIDKDLAPVRIFFSRKINKEPQNILESLKAWRGFAKHNSSEKNVILQLPALTLSAFRDSERPGHFAIEVWPDHVEIVDLGSKNGTVFSELSPAALDKVLKCPAMIQGQTATDNWTPRDVESLATKTVAPKAAIKTKTPTMIRAGKEVRMLLF
jgi:hypothetical protein